MTITRAKRRRVFERDGNACRYCGRAVGLLMPGERLTVDHIVPVSRGGSDHEANLLTACSACNQRKADRMPASRVGPHQVSASRVPMTAREFHAHRERLGLTQYELARALGVSQWKVYALEHGLAGRRRVPDPDRRVPQGIARTVRALRPTGPPSLRPTAEELRWRECIARQACPVCGRDGFRVIARHTVLAHGIDARELRRRAGLPLDASICDPAYAETIRRTRRARLESIAARGAARIRETRPGTTMPHSRGGKLARAASNRGRGDVSPIEAGEDPR